jgi:DNA polymerase-3 subunit delta
MPDGPLALVHGDDDFAVSQRARQIHKAWCEEVDSMDHDTIEATVATAGEGSKVLGRLREAIETLPFFGGGKVVWFKDCNFLGDDRTAKAKDVSSGLADFASLLKTFEWAGVRLLISATKADKRKTFYKTVSKIGHAESFEALSLDDREWQAKAEQVVTAKLKALKKKADYSAVSELTQMVGPNSRALISECEKVAIYVGERDEVSVTDVQAIVIRGKHAKAFALGDALGERDLPRLLKRLDEDLWAVKTDRKKSVIGLVGGLVSKVRSLLFARELMDGGWLKPTRSFPQFKPQIERLPADSFPTDRKISPLGLHPYVLFNAVNQACNYNSAELVRALELLMCCNRRLVSSSLDDTLILQQTLTQIVVREAKAA